MLTVSLPPRGYCISKGGSNIETYFTSLSIKKDHIKLHISIILPNVEHAYIPYIPVHKIFYLICDRIII